MILSLSTAILGSLIWLSNNYFTEHVIQVDYVNLSFENRRMTVDFIIRNKGDYSESFIVSEAFFELSSKEGSEKLIYETPVCANSITVKKGGSVLIKLRTPTLISSLTEFTELTDELGISEWHGPLTTKLYFIGRKQGLSKVDINIGKFGPLSDHEYGFTTGNVDFTKTAELDFTLTTGNWLQKANSKLCDELREI